MHEELKYKLGKQTNYINIGKNTKAHSDSIP